MQSDLISHSILILVESHFVRVSEGDFVRVSESHFVVVQSDPHYNPYKGDLYKGAEHTEVASVGVPGGGIIMQSQQVFQGWAWGWERQRGRQRRLRGINEIAVCVFIGIKCPFELWKRWCRDAVTDIDRIWYELVRNEGSL